MQALADLSASSQATGAPRTLEIINAMFRTYQFCAKPSSSLLLTTLQNFKIPKTNSTLLFSVSTNIPDLENVVSYLSNSAAQSIGCLSAPISRCPDRAICSVGYLNTKDCVPFHSTISGKPPVQVGRWLTCTSSESPHYNDRLPDFSKDVSLWTNSNEPQILPEPLSSLASTRDLNSIVYFTDNAPEGLIGTLNHLPGIKQLGIFASSTPFITGLPFTMFYNGKRVSSGTVGVAFRNSYGTSLGSIGYPRLLPFSEAMKINRVDGNLVHVLDDLNPTALLLKAIETKPALLADKDSSLYLGHSSSATASPVRKVYRIVAGGQSRGALALEGDASLRSGDFVQFYVLQPPAPESTPYSLPGTINFVCTEKDEDSPLVDERIPTDSDDINTLDNLTIASENGFLVSDNVSKIPFRCTVPGSVAHAILEYKKQ